MTHTIAITNHKGGVGKTSIAINLSYSLAQKNKKVLVVDLDAQAHSTSVLADLESCKCVSEMFTSKPAESTIKEVLITSKAHGNIEVIPANSSLSNLEKYQGIGPSSYRRLKKHLSYVEDSFDYIILDCPPSIRSVCTTGAVHAADIILIPCTYSGFALEGTSDLLEWIREEKEEDDALYYIIRNERDKRNKKTNNFVERELSSVEDLLLDTIISDSQEINQASCAGEPVQLYNKDGKASKEFDELSQEILNKIVN